MDRGRRRSAGKAAGVALAVVAMAGGVTVTGTARADSADDHASATAIVAQLEHDGDASHAAVTAEAVGNAKNALERAVRMRAAGDEPHAKAADGLALEWAETGRDLAKAADAETKADELRKKAVDAQAQLERTRALVEEGIARVGRLKAELEEAGRAPHPDRVAVEVHDGEKPHGKNAHDAHDAHEAHGRKGAGKGGAGGTKPVAGEPRPSKTGGAP
jgi:hypothetical protein